MPYFASGYRSTQSFTTWSAQNTWSALYWLISMHQHTVSEMCMFTSARLTTLQSFCDVTSCHPSKVFANGANFASGVSIPDVYSRCEKQPQEKRNVILSIQHCSTRLENLKVVDQGKKISPKKARCMVY